MSLFKNKFTEKTRIFKEPPTYYAKSNIQNNQHKRTQRTLTRSRTRNNDKNTLTKKCNRERLIPRLITNSAKS